MPYGFLVGIEIIYIDMIYVRTPAGLLPDIVRSLADSFTISTSGLNLTARYILLEEHPVSTRSPVDFDVRRRE